MAVKKWADVREHHIETSGADCVARESERILARVRADTLAEVRRCRGLKQARVDTTTSVSVGRVSQIEDRDLSGLAALGGHLDLTAAFGDEQFKVG